ncbi:MAG: GrdX family protein [Clostridiaceae bacterium]|nr:GrdX family protein [Clostridiaceae bacterium]
MKSIIITNNPKVLKNYEDKYKVIFLEGSYLEVLTTTRDLVHKGHELLTHPLSGSIKPNETPYKSIMISQNKEKLNMESLMIIEDSIVTATKFINIKKTPSWPEKVLEDFKEIDYTLITSGMDSIEG